MRLRGLAIAGLLLAAGMVATSPARAVLAAAPPNLTYGWWTQQNFGTTAGSPDVPKDGLLVQNDPGGELAVAAIRFPVGAGAKASIQLTVSGHAVQTQPVKACVLTSSFVPIEGGPWADRPKYDCTSPVTATSTAAGYDLAVTALAREGFIAVAILAGGPADRIAMEKPAASVLAPNAAPSAPPPVVAAAPAPQVGAPPSYAFAQPLPPPPPVSAVAPPQALMPSSAPGASNHVRVAPVVAAVAESAAEQLRRRLGTIAGVGLLIALIVYWADGFGAVRLRWTRPTNRTAVAG